MEFPAENEPKVINEGLTHEVLTSELISDPLSPSIPKTSSPKSSKKKTKLKAAELKKMQNLNEPEYPPLDNLSPDQFMDTVVSTYYEPDFMQPKIDTIIWHHWDDIFSKVYFNWRVVLQRPDNVLLHCSDDKNQTYLYGKTYLCRPFPQCKGMYEAVRLNSGGKVISKLNPN